MSIFKDSFKEGVQNQLKLRQKSIADRTPNSIQYFNSRNAWIRMTSSVNVGNDNGDLANKYVLLGGVLYDKKLKSGVGKTTKDAYSTITADGKEHMLGIRPMPGITSIDVKSKSAYGSLREVTVNFQCWDIKQLEELELLYMRPGYSVLVEWGWTPYLKSDKNGNAILETNIKFYDDVLKGTATKETIWASIFNKASADGNYEGHYGFIKNYSWSARTDGGYDCTTTVISMGEVIESLKINYGDYIVSNKGSYGYFSNMSSVVSKAYSENKIAGICAELSEIILNKKNSNDKVQEVIFNGYTFFVLALSTSSNNNKPVLGVGAQIYITLKDFISVLNDKVLLRDSKSNKPIPELSMYCGAHNGGETTPLLCLGAIQQLSVDPTVCLIKNKNWTNPSYLGLENVLSPSDLETTTNIINTLSQDYWYEGDYVNQQLAVIGNIYINLNYIYSLVTDPNIASQDKKEKNDISLFDFLKNMMLGVSTAIGNTSNFEIFLDPTDNKARIIDINYTGNRQKDKEAFTIELQNTKSVVRSYKLESQIFPEQITTVAIGAQAQGGALASNVNTLIDFNQNLTDRIIPKKDIPSLNNTVDSEEKEKQQLQELKNNLGIIVKYIKELNPGWFGFDSFDTSDVPKYTNALKDIINYYNSIVAVDSKNRAIIPTKLSLQIDGLGGVVIGNLFKIPEKFLPRGYKGGGAGPREIAYVVTGLGHSIQNNDWVTNIDSQFIILDEPRGISSPLAATVVALNKAVTNSNDVTNVNTSSHIYKVAPKETPSGLRYPFEGTYRVSSPFLLERTIDDVTRPHKGSDLAIPVNTPIYAVEEGNVVYADWEVRNSPKSGGGQYVKINHRGIIDGKTTLSMHLNRIEVKVGQYVKKGDLIGYSGNTGHSTAPHLHFELRETKTQTAIDASIYFPDFKI